MINNKKIIVCSAILLALIIGIIATTVLFKSSSNNGNQSVSDNDTQNNIPSETEIDENFEGVEIYTGDYTILSEIEVITPDETLKFYSDSIYMWNMEGLDPSKTDTSKTYVLSMFISNLKGKSLVEKNATELDKYGLSNPRYVINAKFGSETVTFYGGNKTPMEDGYYFKNADSDTVYTLFASDFETMFADSYYYRHIPFFNFSVNTIKKITINKSNSVLEIQKMNEPIYVNNVLYADWEMTKPSYNTLDIKMSNENILDKVKYIGLAGFTKDNLVDDATLVENQYAEIIIENTDGNKNVFRLTPCDADTYYVKINDDPWIYLAYAVQFDFIDTPEFQLVNKFIHFFALDDMSSLVVKTSDKTYDFKAERNGDNVKYKIGDKEIDKKKFSTDVFQNVIGLLATDLCSDAVYSNPELSIEYTLNDGTTEKAELVPYNERNYAVFKNGKCGFIVLKKQVESMLETLDKIK